MDVIYHANCLDGSLCTFAIFLYHQLNSSQLTARRDGFSEQVIEYIFKLDSITIWDNIDFKAWEKEAEKNCTGGLSHSDFLSLPYTPDDSNCIYGLEVDNYEYYFSLMYKKGVFRKGALKDLLIVADATANYESIKRLAKYYKMILLIDHHKSFTKEFPKYQEDKIDNVRIVYSNKFCASSLVFNLMQKVFGNLWQFFNSNRSKDFIKKIEYINRNDTSVPDDDPTNSFIEGARRIQVHKIESLSSIHIFKSMNYSVETLQSMGMPNLAKKHSLVSKNIASFMQLKILRKNDESDPMLIVCYGKFIQPGFKYLSETGKRLAELSLKDNGVGLSVIIRKQDDGYYISLRSIEEDDFDCEDLASYFQGGGHKRAAGCFIQEKRFKDHFAVLNLINAKG